MTETARHTGSIVVTGGGTGGHLYPALSVAEALRALAPNAPMLFVGREAERDRREAEGRGLPFFGLNLQGLKRKLTLANLKAVWLAFSGVARCLSAMKRMPKGVVFGVGGYVSAPAMAAGKLLGWKTALHEQNAVPGLVNRMMAPRCDAVYVTYEETRKYIPGVECKAFGFPLREEMLKQRRESQTAGHERPFTILVIGGSQGAKRLTEACLQAFERMSAQGRAFEALVQTGERNLDWAMSLPRPACVTLTPFIDDMASAYQRANAVVSRAGSGSLSEIALWGLPSVLVPYPFASENHQSANANAFAEAGAALVMEEKDLRAEALAGALCGLMDDPQRRGEMSRNASVLGRGDAADRIARDLLGLIEA